jgi:hypothetical protein
MVEGRRLKECGVVNFEPEHELWCVERDMFVVDQSTDFGHCLHGTYDRIL